MRKLFLTIALAVASFGAVAVTPDKSHARPPQVLYGTYYYASPYYSYSYVAPAPGYYGTIPSNGSYYYQSPYYGSYRLEANAGTWYEPGSDTPEYYAPSPRPAPAPAPAPVMPPSYYDPNYNYGAYPYPLPRYYWGTAPSGFYYSSYYVPYF